MNALARFAARASFAFALYAAAACSSQTEGERCDQPSDCETGLSCSTEFHVCCPVSGQSTVASCNPGIVIVPPDAGPDAVPDANDGSTADTGVDAQEEPAEVEASLAE